MLYNIIFSPVKQHKKYTTFWLLTTKIPISCKTVHRSIARLRTVDRFSIGSISHLILTSQCQEVVPILGLDRQGYWKHLIDMWVERVNFFFKWRCIQKQLWTGFSDNNNFVWPSNWFVAFIFFSNKVNIIYIQHFDYWQKIPFRCKTVLLTGQRFIDQWPYFQSRDIDATVSKRR